MERNGHVGYIRERPVELAAVLESICTFLRRFVVFPLEEQSIVIALWVAHTWAIESFDYTHIFTSPPEKQCGKTRLLDCLGC